MRADLNIAPATVSRIMVGFLPALVALALVQRPIGLPDLGWQLKLGELMLAEGSPFLREPFIVQHLGEPIVPNAWLSQLLLYLAHTSGGWVALRVFDALVWMSGFFIIAHFAQRAGARPLAVLFALGTAFIIALPAASIRPQSFAVPAFAITLALIQYPSRTAVLLGIPLFVLWQNLHPSVSLAVVTIGTVAAIKWVRFFWGREAMPSWLTALCVAAFLSMFATPAGFSIIELSNHNTQASLQLGALEWLPLWSGPNVRFLAPTVISAIVIGIVIVKQRPPMVEVVPAILLFAMSLFAARFVLFYALATLPLLSRLPLGSEVEGRPNRLIWVGAWVLAGLILALGPMKLGTRIPREKLAILGQRSGPIFTDTAYGGEIIYHVPSAKVSFDGRLYLYNGAEIDSLLRTGAEGYDISASVYKAYALTKARSSGLIHSLQASSDWVEIHSDANTVVFIRR